MYIYTKFSSKNLNPTIVLITFYKYLYCKMTITPKISAVNYTVWCGVVVIAESIFFNMWHFSMVGSRGARHLT